MDASDWAAIGTFASAVAAGAAAYVGWRIGRLQMDLSGYSIIRTELQDFDKKRPRDYRRGLCKAHLANETMDREQLLVVLDVMEGLAEVVRGNTIRLHSLWASPFGDLVCLYVRIGKDHIAAEQSNSPTVLESVVWLDKKLRHHTHVRESHGLTRLWRRTLLTKAPAVSNDEINRLLRVEADLVDLPPES